jgi:hypothetical protein
MHDDELYVSDDVWKRQVPRGTKYWLKNQNYVITKNWKNLGVNKN